MSFRRAKQEIGSAAGGNYLISSIRTGVLNKPAIGSEKRGLSTALLGLSRDHEPAQPQEAGWPENIAGDVAGDV
jgi:hypothetical protein